MSEDVTHGELVRRLGGIEETLREMREEARNERTLYVTQTIWTLRNTHVDHRFAELAADLAGLQQDIERRRAPWWAATSTITAVVLALWSLFGRAAG